VTDPVIEVLKNRRGPRLGYCIYCGDDTGPLTKEHALPFGLNGNRTLLDASCDACRKITHRLESDLLEKGVFRDYRYRNNYPSRHKKERPSSLPLGVGEYGSDGRVQVPVNEYPGMVALPLLGSLYPGILRGLTPAESAKGSHAVSLIMASNPSPELVSTHGKVWTNITISSNAEIWRFIAKIAYCCAVWADPTVGRVETPIRDFILGKNDGLAHYLIGDMAAPPTNAVGLPHTIGTIDLAVAGKHWLGAFVQLFANHEGPTYLATQSQTSGPFMLPLPENHGGPTYGVIICESQPQRLSRAGAAGI
jgi:hypothetical protein